MLLKTLSATLVALLLALCFFVVKNASLTASNERLSLSLTQCKSDLDLAKASNSGLLELRGKELAACYRSLEARRDEKSIHSGSALDALSLRFERETSLQDDTSAATASSSTD